MSSVVLKDPCLNRLIFLFDGTWAHRKSADRATIIQTLNELIPREGNTVFYQKGVGAAIGLSEKIIGAVTGRGVKDNIVDAYSFLADNWKPGVEIIIIGFSRGAYTARSFAGLLYRVGVPQHKNDKTYRLLVNAYCQRDVRKQGVPEHLRKKYECKNVEIAALCCFDTVGSLGIPNTGVLGVLKLSHFFYQEFEFHETHPAPNTKFIFHALALHDPRKPFAPTLMHVPEGDDRVLKQVWFPGSHGNLGWEDVQGGLVDIPLAWMLQQLQWSVGLEFNQERLARRFPRFAEIPIPLDCDKEHQWIHSRVRGSKSWFMMLMGHKSRVPGYYPKDGMKTNEEIHPSVRLRGYGKKRSDSAIPGFHCASNQDGAFSWVEDSKHSRPLLRRSDSEASNVYRTIPEAKMDEFEAQLLGVSF
ncbi:hypothetical protein BDY21DRAFT_375870 [Lineolata rhizophorae]|uniref:T6SS Phospholipase effector Tle1-like catalytic domain-containing protein n=1 Tax=Lineolata rhizophorae TaxID=578093 RepID=A0A6A6PDZ7_9PEZI|nr:hypothetical protein BDY21DRAFT_375870 [Lineolata rhizophorae]